MALNKFIGSKWISDILILLMKKESLRFSEILDTLGVTDKVLSGKMSELQKHKLVTRTVMKDRSTVYSLTEKGKTFAIKLAELNKILEGPQ